LLLVAGFFLTGQLVLFLGPLAGLLLMTPPRTRREWLWAAIMLAGFAASLAGPQSIDMQIIRVTAISFAVGVMIVTHLRIASLFNRAAIAATAATIGTIAWFTSMGLHYTALRDELLTSGWDAYRTLFTDLPATLPPADSALASTASAAATFSAQLAQWLRLVVEFYPGLLIVSGLVGAWLAWIWYVRIVRTSLVPPPRPFREFTFNDHLIWAPLAAGALALFVHGPLADLATGNALFVFGIVYSARGLAVTLTAVHAAPAGFKAVLLVISVFMLPLFLVVGVADTWVDFRRRMAPPNGVSS
jgi:hypothetical protein